MNGMISILKYFMMKRVFLIPQESMKEEFVMHVADGGPVEAFCGFFDVVFKGSQENPTDVEVRLSTAPDPTGRGYYGRDSERRERRG